MYIASLYPDDEQDYATSLTSYLILAANVITIPLALSVGYISDKIKAYKLLLLFRITCTWIHYINGMGGEERCQDVYRIYRWNML